MGSVFVKIVDYFHNLKEMFFQDLVICRKRRKLKDMLLFTFFFSVVTFFMLVPAFLQTLQCVLLPVS